MTKLFTRSTVSGANLSGANLKSANTTMWDALNSIGITDTNRTTVTASATLLTTQCGILLVDCTSGSVTLTLPTSGTSTDECEYHIRRVDSTYANTLTVQRGSTDTIEGSATAVSVGCGGDVRLKMPGGSTNWRITGRGGATQLAARDALSVPAKNWLYNPDGAVYSRAVAATADDAYMDDRWYALTQTGSITPSQFSAPEDGYRHGLRLTQSQASAQRIGRAQIVEGRDAIQLRGKTVTFGGRLKLSTSANVRIAILAWTGTEDGVTSDVVNDWTSSNYSASNFFLASNLTVVAVSSAAMTAATARDVSVTGTIPSNANNIIVFYWTEATVAQNVTLDAWGMRLVEAGTLVEHLRRSHSEERAMCRRFRRQTADDGSPGGGVSGAHGGVFNSTSGIICPLQFDGMRSASPTVTIWNNGTQNQVRNTNTGGTIAIGTPTAFGGLNSNGFAYILLSGTPAAAGTYVDFDVVVDCEL